MFKFQLDGLAPPMTQAEAVAAAAFPEGAQK